MKNKHRIALLLVVLLILPMCLSGCNGFIPRSMANRMMEYMHNKYDDTFTYESTYLVTNDYMIIILSSQKYPGHEVYVRSVIDSAGQENYSDNYVAVKYHEQKVELLTEIMDELFPTQEYVLLEDLETYGSRASTDETTFEEFIADPGFGIDMMAFVDNSYELDKEIFEKELEEAIVKRGVCCHVRIFFDDGSGSFEELKNDNMQFSRYISADNYVEEFRSYMDSNEGFSETEWIGKGFGVKSVCEGANAYLDGRYNDTFSYVEGSYYDTTQNANIRMISEQYPNTEVSVHYYKDENGQESYTDNYIAVKYQQQKEDLLSDTMQEVFPEQEYVLISEIGDYDAVNATGETTFEEYMADPQSQITFILVMNEAYDIANREELENTLKDVFAEKGICCSRGQILFDDGSVAFDMLQSGEMTVDGYMRSNGYTNMLEFHMESPESISEYEWEVRDGK